MSHRRDTEGVQVDEEVLRAAEGLDPQTGRLVVVAQMVDGRCRGWSVPRGRPRKEAMVYADLVACSRGVEVASLLVQTADGVRVLYRRGPSLEEEQ